MDRERPVLRQYDPDADPGRVRGRLSDTLELCRYALYDDRPIGAGGRAVLLPRRPSQEHHVTVCRLCPEDAQGASYTEAELFC